MSDFILKISPNILIGSQTISRLGTETAKHTKRCLLIIDPSIKEAGLSDKIKQILSDNGVDFLTYDELPNNPDTATLAYVIKLAKGACIEGVVACGGEKALNLGRGVAALLNEEKPLSDFIKGDQPTKKALPFIAVPTAVRDTFMFYERCAIIDSRSSAISLIKTQDSLTKLAIFDVNLCSSLSKNQIASFCLNIMCMAYEAYFSGRSSFLSDAVAEKIFELMAPATNLTDPLASPDNVDTNLLQCGALSSLAISLSAPGPITALAFAIHARYKTSRTLVCAILLPYLIEESVFNSTKLIETAKRMKVVSENCAPEEAASLLAENIRGRIAKAGLPARLKELSLSMEQLAVAVNDAVQLDFVQYYSKPVSSDSLFNLVKQAY